MELGAASSVQSGGVSGVGGHRGLFFLPNWPRGNGLRESSRKMGDASKCDWIAQLPNELTFGDV